MEWSPQKIGEIALPVVVSIVVSITCTVFIVDRMMDRTIEALRLMDEKQTWAIQKNAARLEQFNGRLNSYVEGLFLERTPDSDRPASE